MNKMPTGYPLNQRAVVDKNVVPEIKLAEASSLFVEKLREFLLHHITLS